MRTRTESLETNAAIATKHTPSPTSPHHHRHTTRTHHTTGAVTQSHIQHARTQRARTQRQRARHVHHSNRTRTQSAEMDFVVACRQHCRPTLKMKENPQAHYPTITHAHILMLLQIKRIIIQWGILRFSPEWLNRYRSSCCLLCLPLSIRIGVADS